jgi:hypothetical protein
MKGISWLHEEPAASEAVCFAQLLNCTRHCALRTADTFSTLSHSHKVCWLSDRCESKFLFLSSGVEPVFLMTSSIKSSAASKHSEVTLCAYTAVPLSPYVWPSWTWSEVNSLQPSAHYMYRQVWHSQILRSAHTVYLCVLCGSQNKQRLFPYTALTDWFL